MLRFPVEDDDTAGGLLPEGVKASAAAIEGMRRDRDYCDGVHAAGAFDQAIERIELRRLLHDLHAAGLSLRVEGETVWVSGPRGVLGDDLAARIRTMKPLLLAALGGEF